jgi:hypothetical protein
LAFYLDQGKYLVGPFLGVYAAGYLFVGLLTFVHGLEASKGLVPVASRWRLSQGLASVVSPFSSPRRRHRLDLRG